MSTPTRATIADLYTMTDKAELVQGEIVKMPPTGDKPSRAATRILVRLFLYAEEQGIGRAYGDNTGFAVNLPHRQSFSPDASLYVGPDAEMKFLQGAPVFALEVRSENDYGPAAERMMAQKRADYFACGTLVVWDVDLLGDDVVRSYRADQPYTPTVFRRGDAASAEPAVPGWTLPVNTLFE